MNQSPDPTPLPRAFYLRPALEVARELIGQRLIRWDEKEPLVGRIVETEAYTVDDPASHSFRGQTARNASMFGPPGHAYVYLIYGMHFCLNVVTGPAGTAEAVLIRAIEPLEGTEQMKARRPVTDLRALTSGPARLCQALGITGEFDGEDLVEGHRLQIAAGPGPKAAVETRSRIGITHSEAAQWLWRFVEPGNPYLSRR